jgi:hypothetical protein
VIGDNVKEGQPRAATMAREFAESRADFCT